MHERHGFQFLKMSTIVGFRSGQEKLIPISLPSHRTHQSCKNLVLTFPEVINQSMIQYNGVRDIYSSEILAPHPYPPLSPPSFPTNLKSTPLIISYWSFSDNYISTEN